MFLIDSLLMAPGNAAMVLFKELARKAQEEWLDDDSIKVELQELYGMLEGGRISDREFEERECRLLERLEQIARAKFRDKWGDDDVPGVPKVPQVPEVLVPEVPQVLSAAPITIDVPALPPAEDPLVAAAFEAPPPVLPVFELAPLPEPTVLQPPPAVVPPVFELAPPPQPPPAPFPPPPAQPPLAAAPLTGPLSIFQVIESATRAVTMLKLRISSMTSVARDDEGWKVTAELVERKGVPDTNDLLGLYELRLDHAGNVLRYERLRMRRRGDLNR